MDAGAVSMYFPGLSSYLTLSDPLSHGPKKVQLSPGAVDGSAVGRLWQGVTDVFTERGELHEARRLVVAEALLLQALTDDGRGPGAPARTPPRLSRESVGCASGHTTR